MACENCPIKYSISNLNGRPMGNFSLSNTLLMGQPPENSFFAFLLSHNPPALALPHSRISGYQILPPNRKVWHTTLFVYVFFPCYSFVVSFIICFYLFLSSGQVWEDCSCLEIEKNSKIIAAKITHNRSLKDNDC